MDKANEYRRKKSHLNAQVPGIPINPDELAPDVLKEWQNYVSEFERQYDQDKTIKVHHRLGQPTFLKGTALDAPTLRKELMRLIQLMESCNLGITTLCPVEDLTLYRFITEELFEYEMEDIQIPGMKTQFCYEAFHPNHAYDLRYCTEDGILNLLSTEEEYWMLGFHDEAFYSTTGELLPRRKMIEQIQLFKDCFDWFEIHEINNIQVQFQLETGKAYSRFFISYSACPQGLNVPLQYQGDGYFGFDYYCDDWIINQLQLPGFVI